MRSCHQPRRTGKTCMAKSKKRVLHSLKLAANAPIAPENGWLEWHDCVLFGFRPIFLGGELAVSFREGISDGFLGRFWDQLHFCSPQNQLNQPTLPGNMFFFLLEIKGWFTLSQVFCFGVGSEGLLYSCSSNYPRSRGRIGRLTPQTVWWKKHPSIEEHNNCQHQQSRKTREQWKTLVV